MKTPPKLRLDQLLAHLGLVESREKARRLIMAGEVTVGGHLADKADAKFPLDAPVVVRAQDRYVGRGGHKLEAALKAFAVDPTGATCLDIGSSTGGFTDCLLQHGAARVWAVDVGTNQLAWKIRNDPRVVVREQFNARHMTAADITDPVTIIVADVSFISLTLILPPARALLTTGGVIVPLIKPQFELRPEQIGKGGIVRDPALHAEAVEKIRAHAATLPGVEWTGLIESPLLGAEGNKEFLSCLRVA